MFVQFASRELGRECFSWLLTRVFRLCSGEDFSVFRMQSAGVQEIARKETSGDNATMAGTIR